VSPSILPEINLCSNKDEWNIRTIERYFGHPLLGGIDLILKLTWNHNETLTFSLTFSNDAGETTEKHIYIKDLIAKYELKILTGSLPERYLCLDNSEASSGRNPPDLNINLINLSISIFEKI